MHRKGNLPINLSLEPKVTLLYVYNLYYFLVAEPTNGISFRTQCYLLLLQPRKQGFAFFLSLFGSTHQVNKDCILDIIRKQRVLPVAKFGNHKFNNNNNDNDDNVRTKMSTQYRDPMERDLLVLLTW